MISLKFQGGPQLARALAGMSFEKEKAVVRQMLKDAAEPIHDEAERIVAIGQTPPHIADHIVVSAITKDTDDLGDRRLEPNEHAVAIGPSKDFFYGYFLEFGTIKMAAKPFMRPAFDSKAGESFKVFQERIWAILRDKAGRSTTGGNT